jgi:hypothetical protein
LSDLSQKIKIALFDEKRLQRDQDNASKGPHAAACFGFMAALLSTQTFNETQCCTETPNLIIAGSTT